MAKAILKVSYETTTLMKSEGVTDGFKTLAILTSDTVLVVKEKLAEKLVKGFSPVTANAITQDIKQMCCKFSSAGSQGNLGRILFDDTVIGELGISPSSNLHLSPLIHPSEPEPSFLA